MDRVSVTVGQSQADLVGMDNHVLQAAVDYVGSFGGGLVRVQPGTYLMHDSLHLRSGVRVQGSGDDTILRKADAVSSSLVLDGDYGEEQVTVANPSGFRPGMGLAVRDDRSGGFHVTVCRIVGRSDSALLIDWPLQADYMVSANAVAQSVFPVLSGYHLTGAALADLTIDGNREANPALTGCRGAGIFLYRGRGCRIENCTVHHFNGDGISFQQSNDVVVQGCRCFENAELGLHPGSGSQRPVITGCHSHHNGRIGLFLCWRVRHGRFQGNTLEENGHTGISIGHKDSDNLFSENAIRRNGTYGIHFRPESEPMAGHRNTFVDCTITGNGSPEAGAGIRVDGATHDLVFRRCAVEGDGRQRYGLSIGPLASDVTLEGVTFEGNLSGDVYDEREP